MSRGGSRDCGGINLNKTEVNEMADDGAKADDGLHVVGIGPDIREVGASVRLQIEALGGVPAFDDKTIGRHWAVHVAQQMQYGINAREAFERVVRSTTLGDNPPAEQQ